MGDPSIQGFATDISVNAGDRISFKIKTDAHDYSILIYRLGYYGGDGARHITTIEPSVSLPQNQPDCIWDASTEITDCGNWAVSAFWDVPETAVSGVYIARPRRSDTGGDSHIVFVVRQDSSTSDLFFQTSDTTWHAYNDYGGSNFYHGDAHGRAYKISYNRPFATRGGVTRRDFLFANEYPMIRFLERNGYDVSYTTNVDSDRRGELIKNHKVFLSVGHDEYWSGNQRANVEAARDAGTHLAFFSGNEVYWRTRWEPSQDGTNTPYRTLVCYKETWADAKIDPSDEWTGTWRDPRFAGPDQGGGLPENGLTGTAYMVNNGDLPLTVNSDEGKLRLWRHTDLTSIPSGGSVALAPHTVGYESNEDLINDFRPEGLIHLSTTTGAVPEYLRDFGNTVTPGETTHHMTLYRAASGALVFSAGTIQFAWGLDSRHDGITSPADPRMQQFVVNLFADMGVQPATLMSGLVATTASTDGQAPTIAITAPAEGTSFERGSQVTVSGTATDVGGGRVAGVEVSIDGGQTWWPATGTTNWSYTFFAQGMGSLVVLARGIDDSVNIGQTPATREFALTGDHTLFGNRTPANPAVTDSRDISLGLRFVPQVDGFVTGIRFYKGSGNTGTHTGSLWTSGGQLMASGTFTNETSTGWQTLTFGTPVPVAAGTTYVASYYAPDGHYAADEYGFISDIDAVSLVAPRNNGLYSYGGGFPSETWQNTNYYVDVTFVPSEDSAPIITSLTPLDGANGVDVTVQPAVAFSKALDESSIEFTLTPQGGSPVAGSVTYDDALRVVTFVPAAALEPDTTYTASVTAADPQGHPVSREWTFKTLLDAPIYTLFASTAVPSTVAEADPDPVSLGVRFVPAVSGLILGIRFYQGPGNVGDHPVTLWTSDGTPLATTTVPGSADTGWRTGYFSNPVSVTAGTTYVASYYAPNGHYAADGDFFESAWTSGPLTAPSGDNGVFRYNGNVFPDTSYRSTNYWVDPLFVPTGGWTPPTETPTPSPTPTPSSSPTPTPSPTATPTPPPPIPEGTYTLFAQDAAPGTPAHDESAAVEVGVQFTPAVSGSILGIRFYQGPGNTGEHPVTLWSTTGTALATATVPSSSEVGWRLAYFSTPVSVTAGTSYVASYHAPNGHYAADNQFFTSVWKSGPLTAPAVNNGLYRYGTTSAFPIHSYQSTNYWVDPLFLPDEEWTEPDPEPPGPPPTAYGLFSPTSAPANVNWNDSDAVEVGMRFTSSVNGMVYGVRFYKGPQNVGVHTGSLWDGDSGVLRATATFVDESEDGWQTVLFAEPVAIVAGKNYIVSYHTSVGRYAVDINAFSAGATNNDLSVPATGGVYRYGNGGLAPTSQSNHNFWVDVIFAPQA